MLERTEGDVEGLDVDTKRVKLEEQVTTVAIPQQKVSRNVHFWPISQLLASLVIKRFIAPHRLVVRRHVLTT